MEYFYPKESMKKLLLLMLPPMPSLLLSRRKLRRTKVVSQLLLLGTFFAIPLSLFLFPPWHKYSKETVVAAGNFYCNEDLNGIQP